MSGIDKIIIGSFRAEVIEIRPALESLITSISLNGHKLLLYAYWLRVSGETGEINWKQSAPYYKVFAPLEESPIIGAVISLNVHGFGGTISMDKSLYSSFIKVPISLVVFNLIFPW